MCNSVIVVRLAMSDGCNGDQSNERVTSSIDPAVSWNKWAHFLSGRYYVSPTRLWHVLLPPEMKTPPSVLQRHLKDEDMLLERPSGVAH